MIVNLFKFKKKRFTSSSSDSSESKTRKIYAKYKNIFEKKVFSDIVLRDEDKACAEIANESYLFPELRRKVIFTYTLDETLEDKLHVVYFDSDKKICIIWYRWTDFKDIKDLSSDIHIVLDIQWIDPRVKKTLEIYDVVRRKYMGYNIRVCGHSLGGTLSYIVGKHRSPDRCVAFNPWVSFNTFFVQMIQNTLQSSQRTTRTYTYKVLWDIISLIGFVGNVKTFVIKKSDPLSLHAMTNFLPSQDSDV